MENIIKETNEKFELLKEALLQEWFSIKGLCKFWNWEQWNDEEFKALWHKNELSSTIRNSCKHVLISYNVISETNILFHIEKEWKVIPVLLWSFVQWKVKLMTAWRYYTEWVKVVFDKHTLLNLLQTVKSVGLTFWFKLNEIPDDVYEFISSKLKFQEWTEKETMKIISFEWINSLDEYIAQFKQKTRYEFRRARRDADELWYKVEILNWEDENFEKELVRSFDTNTKLFNYKALKFAKKKAEEEWRTLTKEEESSISWNWLFRPILWKTSPRRKYILALVSKDMRIAVVKTSEWEHIASLFYLNDYETKENWLLNWASEEYKDKNAFRIVWTYYIEDIIKEWILKADLMSFPWTSWVQTGYKEKYGRTSDLRNLYSFVY